MVDSSRYTQTVAFARSGHIYIQCQYILLLFWVGFGFGYLDILVLIVLCVTCIFGCILLGYSFFFTPMSEYVCACVLGIQYTVCPI